MIPPVLGFWFFVHPFTALWRKAGFHWYRLFVGTYFAAFASAMYMLRQPLLSICFGVRTPLIAASAVFLILSLGIAVLRQRHLKTDVLMGIPQVAAEKDQTGLITTGIYSRTRNPRYLELGFSFAAMACFSNYLAAWILLALYVPVIHAVVLMEERELRERYGTPYEDYCRAVPRYVPNFASGGADGHGQAPPRPGVRATDTM